MECPYRKELEAVPERIKKLPTSRGYPVPWFVAWVDGEPEFRAADSAKFVRAIREQLCWVCGERLGTFKTFVIGPMCGLNRTTSEPPCHTECASWSARNCPFLNNPDMVRREKGLDNLGAENPGGIMLKRNPGVTLLWTTKKFNIFKDGMGGHLIRIGDPVALAWYTEGRGAMKQEIEDAIERGCPAIKEVAEAEGALDQFNLAKSKFDGIWKEHWA
jgi:hypothetical protein